MCVAQVLNQECYQEGQRCIPMVVALLPPIDHKMGSPPTQPKKVTFGPGVQFERTSAIHRPKRAMMTAEITTEIFREFEAKDVTDEILTEAALLFSENYGVWDTPDGQPGPKRGILTPGYRFIDARPSRGPVKDMDSEHLANAGF